MGGEFVYRRSNNHRIRKVECGGTITTVAGNGTSGFAGDEGAATAASLNNPAGVAMDATGNLYIADWVTIASVRLMRGARSRRWQATARQGSRATAVRRRRQT
jgi:hypothetical protein